MKYKLFSRISRILLYAVNLAVIAVLVVPFWQYNQKTPIEKSLNYHTEPSSTLNWIDRYYKIEVPEKPTSELVFINDPVYFRDTEAFGLANDFVVFESLFNKLSESIYATQKLNYYTSVQYSGFTGKSYLDLGDLKSISPKLIEQYQMLYGEDWPYRGEGIILYDANRVIILQKGKDYHGDMLLEINSQTDSKTIPYYGIFEVTQSPNDVLASFKLDMTTSGAEKLSEIGVKSSFPAVYQLKNNSFDGVYMAGNFTENVPKVISNYEWIISLMQNKGVFETYTNEQAYWQFFIPFYEKQIKTANVVPNVSDTKSISRAPNFIADRKTIFIRDSEGNYQPFFIKGANLGPALPGKFFTEFPEDFNIYTKWLTQMSEMNLNTVRVYTLLPPTFYHALYEFNQNSDKPLYLLQEIWPEEHPVDSNYLDAAYNEVFKQEIDNVIDAIHGKGAIPKRDYRAYGEYVYDVSPYCIGYLVGREMEPEEVVETDRLNSGYSYAGEYVYSEREASPTESWLAESCDYALKIENDHYQNKPLIAIVNWPTLDPLVHDSEWNSEGDKSLQYNDKTVVDIDRIGINRQKVSGMFGAYHIYPNYPNFMNNDSDYADYHDDAGEFRYGGYLEAFINQHNRYPAVVAEYGMSTSSITAHYNPNGLNHGGVSETDQAEDIMRMASAIVHENYAGAVIFEWLDEWAKKTWTTEFYMIPYDNRVLWHNVMDPEQNYGILAYEATEPELETVNESQNHLNRVQVGQNVSYLYLEMQFDEKPNLDALEMAINTNAVTVSVDGTTETEDKEDEFIVKMGLLPQILVNPGYNWVKGHYQSVGVNKALFESMIQIVNPENLAKDGTFTPARYVDLSQLHYGHFDGNLNEIQVQGNTVTIRIPYTLMGISDPSTRRILWDSRYFVPTTQDQIETQIVKKMAFELSYGNQETIKFEYEPKEWIVPSYQERLKSGYNILAEYFKQMQ